MSTWRWALAPLALLIAANPAVADDAEPGKKPGATNKPSAEQRQERRQAMLKRFDTDEDGELSQEERQAMREQMQKRRGEGRNPRNAEGRQRGPRDDQAKPEGRRRGPRDGQAKPEGRRRGPRDGDNAQRREGPPAKPSPERLFDKFDADGDGQLTKAEFSELTDKMRGRRPGSPRGDEGRPGGREMRERRDGDQQLRGEGQRRRAPGERAGRGDRNRGPRDEARGDRGPRPRRERPDFEDEVTEEEVAEKDFSA